VNFLHVKMIYNTVFYNVFYTVKIVYDCVLMTCSTFYCVCDTLMDQWNVCIYVCTSRDQISDMKDGACDMYGRNTQTVLVGQPDWE
jgi:hypothetical protein